MLRPLSLLLVTLLVAPACSSETEASDPLDGLTIVGEDPTDIPLRGASEKLVSRFLTGDLLFDAVFREPDGLGPLYIRSACGSCHAAASRGPGAVQKVALVGPDGVTPSDDQSDLAYGHTIRPYMAAGAVTPITAPMTSPTGMKLLSSQRLGPAVFGRGYMEAVADSEILRMEDEQAARSDGIHGRVNRVVYISKPNPEQAFHSYKEGQEGIIGRFGFKARSASLDDFTADAFQGDMSITSPLRPEELSNPDGLTDDEKPGLDVDFETVNAIADYMRLLEMPRRSRPEPRGEELFTEVKCAVCHAPSLRTRDDYPIAELAGIEAQVFTDFLLHDMGDWLADGLTDGQATSRDWRTTPLIGLRHFKTFLHDGRAKSVEEAILLHGGAHSEAGESVDLFKTLSIEDKAALIAYVRSL